jgi:site-specific DNA-methyltransferase (adenine-specific)
MAAVVSKTSGGNTTALSQWQPMGQVSRQSGTGSGSVSTDTRRAATIRNLCGRFARYQLPPTQHTEQQRVSRTGGTWAEKYAKKIIGWDVAPTAEYFAELFRVAKNQIIWGANYFPNMPPTRCFIVWRKLTISEKFSMAMAEYAWTSFQANAKVFECAPQGKKNDVRFHPTQKPIALYKWLLANYAKEGDTILDTHLGSGSSAIACADMGFTMTGIEIDEYYYQKARERLLRHTAQLTLF